MIFNVSPLKKTLESLLAHHTFKIPTYVTIASRKLMFDPDKPGFYHIGGQIGYIRRAMEEELFIPHYVRLDQLETRERTQVLLASASLPFGIFPEVELNSNTFVDGGMIDNCPVYPLVSLEACSSVIVVRLRPVESGFLKMAWQLVDRILRVAEMEPSESRRQYHARIKIHRISSTIDETIDPPLTVPYRIPERWPEQIHVIAPRRSLGWFLSGTMNFRAHYANKLIDMGYRDAMEVLQINGFVTSTPATQLNSSS